MLWLLLVIQIQLKYVSGALKVQALMKNLVTFVWRVVTQKISETFSILKSLQIVEEVGMDVGDIWWF